MKWENQPLGKYIDVISGYAFKSKDFMPSGIPVIKIKNVSPPEVSLDDLSYISVEIANDLPKFALHYGDVLIALTGSHINQMASVVGRVARVKHRERSMLNQRVGKIVVKDIVFCDLNYVYYYLSQDQVKITLARKAGGAANQANISPSDIRGLEIPFPSVDIQRRIADILSAYDDLIENNQKQINLLEEAAMRLYKEWFVHLRFPGHEITTIVDDVPERWKKGVLNDIALNVGGNIPKAKRDFFKYYLPIDCIPKKSIAYKEYRPISEAESSLISFASGDIIFGAMRPYFHKVMYAPFDGLTRTTCFVINAQIESYLFFILMLLFDEDTIKYATQISVGTTMPYVRWKDFVCMPVLIPSESVSQSFSNFVKPTIEQLVILSKQNDHLRQARDKLLPKLMNGEIEV